MSRGLPRAALVAAAAALVGGTAFTVADAQPREMVVVARHNLRAGTRLTAADVTVSAVPDGGGHASSLLPGSLVGLMPGQYLSRPVIAGSPLLPSEIHPAAAHVRPLAAPVGVDCGG